MKKIYIFSLFLALAIMSCENELDIEPAQSLSVEVALSSESNISNILIGAYEEAGQVATFGGRTHLIADLLGSTNEVSWNGTFLDPRQFFSKSILVDNGFSSNHWANSYEVINQVNLVIDNLDIITSSVVERDRIEGEAKFLRALSYFDLVRLFALPYQRGGNNTQLGVPLRLTGITDYSDSKALEIARSSVEDTYTQILSDITDAEAKLPNTNSFFADKFAVLALKARVYFQQGDYANARDAANEVLTSSGHSLTPAFEEAFNNDVDSQEDVFTFQVTSQTGANSLITFYASEANGGRGDDITVEAGYLALFDDPANDERASFTYIDNGSRLTSKYTNQFGNVPVFRIAEMHLIRAESNFREGTAVGLEPLVEINALRFRSNAAALTTLTNDVFFNERQLELAFEGHLVHDYKRTQKSIGGIPFDSDILVLPIPQQETDTNSLMVQNPGYVN